MFDLYLSLCFFRGNFFFVVLFCLRGEAVSGCEPLKGSVSGLFLKERSSFMGYFYHWIKLIMLKSDELSKQL